MGYRSKVKSNVPKVRLDSIVSLIVGTFKSGKTRLWKEVVELHYENPEEALLISFEKGYETWELENILPIHEQGEEWEVWDYFRKVVVKELVQEAKDGRVVKLIGFDTADRMIDACSAWILEDKGKKYGKKFTSLQEISDSTSENGWTLLYEELKRQFDALTNAKYGIMSLAWSKERETTLYTGLKYNSIDLMMNNSGRKVFESQASFICCLHNEVIVKDRDGNELDDNVKDKKGKDKASNFHETKPVMTFRPSEFVSIAGGRYTDLPDYPIDYSAENFLDIYEKAVKGNLKKNNKSVEELEQEQKSESDDKAREYAESKESEYNIADLHTKITEKAKTLSDDNRKIFIPKIKEIVGFNDYRKSDDIAKLENLYKELETLTQ